MTLSELYMGLSQASRMAELDTVSARMFLGALGRLSDITTIRRAMARTEPCSFSAWHWYMPSSSGMIWLITSLLWKQTTRVFHYEKKNLCSHPVCLKTLIYWHLTKPGNITCSKSMKYAILKYEKKKWIFALNKINIFEQVDFFALFS